MLMLLLWGYKTEGLAAEVTSANRLASEPTASPDSTDRLLREPICLSRVTHTSGPPRSRFSRLEGGVFEAVSCIQPVPSNCLQ